jgi:molybdopterin-guanine dinucleotide biosynthesis adapter protein
MAMVSSAIFQIVGFQNSGKTTLIKRLIEELKKQNVTAVTIKHHGHGGRPAFNKEKDSYQHIQAGAIASIVEGDGHLLLQSEKSSWTLNEQIQLLSVFQPNVIFIEGHKKEIYPKAVIIRNREDLSLLENLENIKLVLFWDKDVIEPVQKEKPYPFFPLNDSKGLKWLVQNLNLAQ